MNTDKPGAPYYQRSVEETLASVQSSPEGISGTEAATRLQQYGENALPQKPGKPAWLRFIAHFNDVLIYVLLAAALLKAVMGHWIDMAVILAVAVVNALIGFIQESNAEKSLQSIRNMLSSEAVAIRQGNHETIPTTSLVPGDIVVIRAGDRIPADLRVIEAHNLRVEEAILTGESTVVEKTTEPLSGDLPLGDRSNLLFSGTTVSSGAGKGIVVATGGDTELGHINQMMAGIEKHRTPLLVQMDKLGKAIFILILVMMAALFVFSLLFRDMPVSELMLSLISLAVASVPEGLPAIISIILSLGVQAMARQKAIIRKLPTVETLGAMTVICSDKTGTLTMNEMTVKAVITADSVYRVEGDSYEPVGKIHAIDDPTPVTIAPGSLFERYLRTIDLCNDSQLIKEESGLWKITGGPTEGALKVLAAKVTLPPLTSELRSKIPFDSQYKYMSTLYRLGEEEVVLVTGAPDVLFRLCQYQQSDSGLQPLDLPYWEGKIEEYAREGLRMVAAAWKPAAAGQTELTHQDLQQGVILLGVAGMMDPPRPEAIEAINACQQAGIALAGGHSIDAPEPIFGLAVTGVVPTERIKKNSTAQAGCKLYLTKPLGIGVLTTAEKKSLLKPEHQGLATETMCQMNLAGAAFAAIDGVKAMTDVTGFGLLGHLSEVCRGAGVQAQLRYADIPKLPGVEDYIAAGAVPGGTGRNFASYGHLMGEMPTEWRDLLCDPQTSGGLLLAVTPEAEAEVQAAAAEFGIKLAAIGELVTARGGRPMIEIR